MTGAVQWSDTHARKGREHPFHVIDVVAARHRRLTGEVDFGVRRKSLSHALPARRSPERLEPLVKIPVFGRKKLAIHGELHELALNLSALRRGQNYGRETVLQFILSIM